MRRHVYKWREHYIGYDTTPELDGYFEAQGLLAARECLGHDSFPGDAQFGGHDLNLYRAAVAVLIGWALKHQAFCAALLDKHPELSPRNVLTITSLLNDLEIWMAAQLEADEEQARLALETVTLGLDNKDVHRKAGPFPCLIRVGNRHVIKSLAGTVGEPFFFMLRELRRRFPSDWDKAVDSREAMFRRDLFELFGPFGLLLLSREMKLYCQDQVATDIDAAIADHRCGVLGLFQLKWQDLFGHSMRERESRRRNLLIGSNAWIAAMREWIAARSAGEVGMALGLPADVARKLRTIRLFILSRSFSRFSGEAGRDDRAAWGNWAQLCRCAATKPRQFAENPLEFVYREFKEDHAVSQQFVVPGRVELVLGKVTVVVEPPTR